MLFISHSFVRFVLYSRWLFIHKQKQNLTECISSHVNNDILDQTININRFAQSDDHTNIVDTLGKDRTQLYAHRDL